MINPLLHILHLADPTLPIGGFSHSAGLETYVQEQLVTNAPTAQNWIIQMLQQNIRYTDAAFLALAFKAFEQNNLADLQHLDNWCTAVKLPKEMRMASQKLGMRLLKIFEPLLNNPLVHQYAQLARKQLTDTHFCIVFGVVAAAMQLPLLQALQAFYYNAASGFVTNSVKLIPLSQHDGQQILFALLPIINALAEQSVQPNENLIGICCAGFDLRSMQHEQLYSRLYMS